jgi:translation initiation factor RLI1
MPGKMALVNYSKCQPTACDKGICTAAEACPRKLLVQESPYEAPMPNPSLCRACGDCVRACPAKAIQIIAQ